MSVPNADFRQELKVTEYKYAKHCIRQRQTPERWYEQIDQGDPYKDSETGKRLNQGLSPRAPHAGIPTFRMSHRSSESTANPVEEQPNVSLLPVTTDITEELPSLDTPPPPYGAPSRPRTPDDVRTVPAPANVFVNQPRPSTTVPPDSVLYSITRPNWTGTKQQGKRNTFWRRARVPIWRPRCYGILNTKIHTTLRKTFSQSTNEHTYGYIVDFGVCNGISIGVEQGVLDLIRISVPSSQPVKWKVIYESARAQSSLEPAEVAWMLSG
ncbi:uncharacterized protein BT62DRAFT_1006175 [Guyanagaster necrorhizus]|uniref:Uncharacterized protein n=1 Tax=Guyanagaster necrorhizus TaxID=856835 RepID=A0A9P8AS74_9AGAR|nr:uncharacterized protein BT62DRAFT_1006175 [Guyanagaster necrorhizus MCA 3950]KAG7445999.1 hypothetical protein BT62DRAFT_1006175 [Guyanagaster necrorhizus MCA 3950]